MASDRKICPNCGNTTLASARFCGQCGYEMDFDLPEGERSEPSLTPPLDSDGKAGTQETSETWDADSAGGDDGDTWDTMTEFIPAYHSRSAPHFIESDYVEHPIDIAKLPHEKLDPFDESNKKHLIYVLAAALAVAALVIGVMLWVQVSDRQAAYDREHTLHQVALDLTAPGYNDQTDSPIPVHVTGTDSEGHSVEQDFYVGADNAVIQLYRGNYDVSIGASPLMANGTLYSVPTDDIELKVGGNDFSDNDLSWTFETESAVDITDDMIDSAYRCALASGMDAAQADALKAKVTQIHQTALDEKTESESAGARQKAAEDAAANVKQGQRYSNSFVSCTLPDTWTGLYTATYDEDTSGTWTTNFVLQGSTITLLRFTGKAGSGTCAMQYQNTATLLWQVSKGNSQANGATAAQLEQALSLQTGGTLTKSQVLAYSTADRAETVGTQAIEAYLNKGIASTVKAY